jgi:predicted component of type VI protein secretion system
MSVKSDAILAGLFAAGESISEVVSRHVTDDALKSAIARDLMALLNQIEATAPREEFLNVVKGAMRGLGFDPTK